LRICEKLGARLIRYKLLGAGAFNISYFLLTNKGEFVLRINSSDKLEKIRKEYEFLEKSSGKFGPKVYLIDVTKSILPYYYFIEEYIDGYAPGGITDEFLKTMGKFYIRLHQIYLPILPEYTRNLPYYSLMKAFEWCTEDYYQNKHVLEDSLLKILDLLYSRSKKIVKNNEFLFEKTSTFSANQGDPSRSNVFIKPNSIKLVDWEYMRYDLREWDLAFFVWVYELNQDQKIAFLKYSKYLTTPPSLFCLEIISLLHCLMILSWKVKRLNQVLNCEINKILRNSTVEEVSKSIFEDIPFIEKSIQKLI